jgi:hypothetical protein
MSRVVSVREVSEGRRTENMRVAWVVMIAVGLCAELWGAPEGDGKEPFEGKWKGVFPKGASLVSVTGLDEGQEAYEVQGPNRRIVGWVFRSDRVDPAIKGKRGEIAVLVGVSTNRTITGVVLVESEEDAKWFDRITADFYGSFSGKTLEWPLAGVDTVTGATVSSEAIIKDVFLSAWRLLEKPAVRSRLGK